MRKLVSIREFFQHLIPDEKELDAFTRWAFGVEVDGLNCFQIMEAWNKLHREEMELKPIGLVAEDAPKMIILWRGNRLA